MSSGWCSAQLCHLLNSEYHQSKLSCFFEGRCFALTADAWSFIPNVNYNICIIPFIDNLGRYDAWPSTPKDSYIIFAIHFIDHDPHMLHSLFLFLWRLVRSGQLIMLCHLTRCIIATHTGMIYSKLFSFFVINVLCSVCGSIVLSSPFLSNVSHDLQLILVFHTTVVIHVNTYRFGIFIFSYFSVEVIKNSFYWTIVSLHLFKCFVLLIKAFHNGYVLLYIYIHIYI